jgi:cell division protein FtsA
VRPEPADPFLNSVLDIGTRKVAVAVFESDPATTDYHVNCIATARSTGIRKGDILDPDLAVESIRQAFEKAEKEVGLMIRDTVVSFGPSKTGTIVADYKIRLRNETESEKPVNASDMREAVVKAISTVCPRPGEFLMHAFPLEYSVDGGQALKDPRGIKGTELLVSVLCILVPEKSFLDVLNCVRKSGVHVHGIIHKAVSSALGSLVAEEMKRGTVVVDIGAGTTSITRVSDGRIKGVSLLPTGGDHVTGDVSEVLGIPSSAAEYLKREVSLTEEDESLSDELEMEIDGKPFVTTVEEVLYIVSSRFEEMIVRFVKPGILSLSTGKGPVEVLFSGGGTRSPGFEDAVEEMTGFRCRIAEPVNSRSLPPGKGGPEFTSLIGAIRYIFEREEAPLDYLEPSFETYMEGLDDKPSVGREPSVAFGSKGKPFRSGRRGEKNRLSGLADAVRKAFRELF